MKRSALFLLASMFFMPAGFGKTPVPESTAYRLFENLTGIPPTRESLLEIHQLINSSGIKQAASKIINENEEFYSVTLFNLFTPWSNREGTTHAPLNDMTATLIGTVRDNHPFNTAFFEDVLYFVDGELAGNSRDRIQVGDITLRMAFKGNNDHFEDFTKNGMEFTNPALLMKRSQKPIYHTHDGAIAGIFSTRQYAEAWYQAGTNRRPVASSMKNFLCREMETLNDTTIAAHRVRRDVDRNPGGNAATFTSLCVGCHAGMDGLAGAFAYYDFQAATRQVRYTPGVVVAKMNHNALFQDGHVTQSDSWENLWTTGQNAVLGWSKRRTGRGADDFGRMITETEGFGTCMAIQVYQSMCFQEFLAKDIENVRSGRLVPELQNAITDFRKSFNFKQLYIDVAPLCVDQT